MALAQYKNPASIPKVDRSLNNTKRSHQDRQISGHTRRKWTWDLSPFLISMIHLRGQGNPHTASHSPSMLALKSAEPNTPFILKVKAAINKKINIVLISTKIRRAQKPLFFPLWIPQTKQIPLTGDINASWEKSTRKYIKVNCIYLLLFHATRYLPNSHWSQVHRAQDTLARSLLQLHRYWHPRNESEPKAVQPVLQYWMKMGKSRRAESEAWDCWKAAVAVLAL